MLHLEMKHSFPLVKVVWVDSSDCGSWLTLDQINNMSLHDNMVSVGFLVRNDPDFIIVSANIGNEHFGATTLIPRVAIKMITHLEDNKMTTLEV